MQRGRGHIKSRPVARGRLKRLLLAVLVLGALAFPAVAEAAPVACFTQSPAAPYFTGTTITFNSSCSSGFSARGWDLDNDGQYDDGTGVTATKSFATPGTYTIKLGVIDNQNRYDIESKQVTVSNRPPVSSFTYTPTAPKSGESITFTSTSTDPDGSVASQSWDFDGDGFDDGSTAGVTKSFPTPGTITARLRVVDDRGAEHTSTQTVTIANRAPVASFTVSASPTTGSPVTFTSTATDPDGTIASQAWELDNTNDFNDGTGTTTSRTYSTPGTYTVKLRVTDNKGAQHTATGTVTVANRPPVASFTYAPASPISGQSVTFTSTSTDPDGSVASQAWEFDNTNDFNDGTGTTVSRTFNRSGGYTIKLRVTDNSGAQHITSQFVTIGNRNPSASFTFAPDTVQSGEPLTFTSSSSDVDGTIASQAWEFDGTNDFNDGSGATATRTFTAPGTYTIKLRVRDNLGGEDIKSQTVTVGNRSPVAAFDVAPLQPISKQAITFTSSSSDPDGTIASQAWEFDGTNDFDDGIGATATRTYAAPGTYTVKLRVRDNSGTEKVASRTITVANRPPTAAFAHTPSAPVAGDPVQLTATAADEDGTIATHAWDLDNDGQFDDAAGATASFTPSAAGSYPVGLKVTDDSGDSAIATGTIVVADRALPRPIELPAAGEGGSGGAFDTTGPAVTIPQPDPEVRSPVAPVLRWLDPFPVIRIRGLATRKGAKLTLLSVTAPAGVTATLRCAGRGCPVKRLSAKVKAAKGKGVGVVRFRKIERSLPAGTRLEVAVTARGLVGKYTRFTIRRLALPARTDRCMIPGTTRPATCPSTR
jgi:PKD repeat protein